MDISIGSKIYLKREFVDKIAADQKTSLDFQVVATTDHAIGLRNLRTGRNYTLSIDAVSNNVENRSQSVMPKGRIVNSAKPQATVDTKPTDDTSSNTTEVFTHDTTSPTGGVEIKETTTSSSLDSSDDPFSGLYT